MSTHFLHTVSELGAGNAAWYAAARLLRIVGLPMWRYHFVAQRVAPAAMRNSPGKLVMCPIASLADLPCQYPRPREVVAARFRQGGYSIAAWKGRELAAILWYQFGAYEEDEVRALLPAFASLMLGLRCLRAAEHAPGDGLLPPLGRGSPAHACARH